MEYRADIDGLRAVAVAAVVLYHAYPGLLPGGFVGVDVFFVISGYLISGLLYDGLDRRRLDLLGFYARRIRRIFPALLVVLPVTLAYGSLVLLPSERAVLGQSVAAGAGFVANLLLWRQSGYFDTDSATKPLLHLWSLGVEEQFYLLWPPMLWAVGRWRAALVGGAAALSFAAALLMIPSDAAGAFYLPVTRLWELAVGGALALRPLALPLALPRRTALSALGLALICGAAWRFDAATPMPGWPALVPVAGAGLLIAAGPQAGVNRRVLAWAPVVWLGLISYPLYLWHWPPLAFAHVVRLGRPPTPLMSAALIAFSVGAAWLTTRCLERPIRFGSWRRPVAGPLLLSMGAVLALGLGVARLPGGTGDLNIARINAANAERIFQPTRDMTAENHDETYVARIGVGPTVAVLAGDSRLFHYGPRLQRLWEERRLTGTVVFVVGASCPPVPGVRKPGAFTHCSELPRLLHAQLAASPGAALVLGAGWQNEATAGISIERDGERLPAESLAGVEAFYANLRDFTAAAVADGHPVFLLLSSPVSERFAPRHMVSRSIVGYAADPHAAEGIPVAALRAAAAVADAHLGTVAAATGARLLDPVTAICGSGPLCSPLDETGSPKFVDDQHLRAGFVATRFTLLDSIVTRPP